MKWEKVIWINTFVALAVGIIAGFITARIYQLNIENIVERLGITVTVSEIYTPQDVAKFELGSRFFIAVADTGIGYWSTNAAMFLGLDVGQTYCLEVVNSDMGPQIVENLGKGECR